MDNNGPAMTRPLAAADVGARECSHCAQCVPMTVRRCAHFEGQVVYLAQRAGFDPPQWKVSRGDQDVSLWPFVDGEGMRALGFPIHTVYYVGPDLRAAEAAFWEAEAQLREEVRE